jgi:hypothetical protein
VNIFRVNISHVRISPVSIFKADAHMYCVFGDIGQ